MNALSDVPVFHGSLVRLEPLSVGHAADLAVAAEEDRSAYGCTVVPRAWEMEGYLAAHSERAREGQLVPLAQVSQRDGRAVGVTAYWDPRPWPGRSELCAIDIGWTWLAASAQRTGINVEAKLLLLDYAFEMLGVVRVGFSTDARNERSRRAIAGLGARFEGVLRHWSPSRAPGEDGLLRDSAIFSVIASEWPAIKAAMHRRLARATPSETAGDESTVPAMSPAIAWAEVTIDCRDTRRIAEFWGQLLGHTPRDVGRPGWYRIGPLTNGGPALTFQPVPETKTTKTPVHLDLRVADLDATIGLIERLHGSGPAQVHRYPEGTVAVMADPEGHEFCLVALSPGAALT